MSLVNNDNISLNIDSGWNGRIANVGFWHRPLRDSDMTALYDSYSPGAISDDKPEANVTIEDRGAHGTKRVAHNADAIVTRMRSTVPSNALVMDELSDQGVPGFPASIECLESW